MYVSVGARLEGGGRSKSNLVRNFGNFGFLLKTDKKSADGRPVSKTLTAPSVQNDKVSGCATGQKV